MKRHDTGARVKRVQEALNMLGFPPGQTIDGDYGRATSAAVAAWKEARHQPGTGDELTDAQVAALLAEPSPWALAVNGVDVSGYNPDVDWAKVAAADYRFAVVKVTEGLHYTNDKAAAQLRGARDALALVDAYHFPGSPGAKAAGGKRRPRRFGAAKDEAAFFLDQLAATGVRVDRHWLDGEAGLQRWTGTESVAISSPEAHTTNARWWLDWLEAVEARTGIRPGVYTARWAIDAFLRQAEGGLLEELGRYPLWFADYHDIDVPAPKDVIWPWQQIPEIWQWTAEATVPGVLSGHEDADRMLKDVFDRRVAAAAPPVVVPPAPPVVVAPPPPAAATAEQVSAARSSTAFLETKGWDRRRLAELWRDRTEPGRTATALGTVVDVTHDRVFAGLVKDVQAFLFGEVVDRAVDKPAAPATSDEADGHFGRNTWVRYQDFLESLEEPPERTAASEPTWAGKVVTGYRQLPARGAGYRHVREDRNDVYMSYGHPELIRVIEAATQATVDELSAATPGYRPIMVVHDLNTADGRRANGHETHGPGGKNVDIGYFYDDLDAPGRVQSLFINHTKLPSVGASDGRRLRRVHPQWSLSANWCFVRHLLDEPTVVQILVDPLYCTLLERHARQQLGSSKAKLTRALEVVQFAGNHDNHFHLTVRAKA